MKKYKVRFILRHFSLGNITFNMENNIYYCTNEH